MKNCEEASEKLTNCTCYNLKRRPCQYEVLYDEALCQVESLQRQVRHLRTEVRRIEDENSVLLQQSEKASSDPNQEIIQLKTKYEKELQRREESWQKELQKWRKEFQNRDVEIRMLRTRIAELEADSAKSAGPDKARSELVPNTTLGSLPVDDNLQKKHNSLPPPDDCHTERLTKLSKSYDEIVDELFGSSPQPDEPQGEGNENRSTGIVTDHDETKQKPTEKKTTALSPTKDKVKPVEQSGSKKGSNSVPSSVPSKMRMLKESSRTSPLATSGTSAHSQKITAHSGIKEKDNSRNVFERMKVSGIQDRKAVPSPSETKRLEADSGKRSSDLCKEDNPKTTSTKDMLKPTSFDSKAKVNLTPHKRFASSSSKPDQHESQKSGTVEGTKKNSYDRKHDKKRKVPDVSGSPKIKEQNSQKRNKIDAAEVESGQEQNAKKHICKTGQELAADQSQLCAADKNKSSACKQLSVSGTSKQKNAHSDVCTSPSAGDITVLKTKAVKVKRSEASNECSQNIQKVNKKEINLSDAERMKAYMDLATRINSEKRKHKASNKESKIVDKETSSATQKGAKADLNKTSTDVKNGDPVEQCTEPSLSVDLDNCPNEPVTTQYQSSGGCYSPSVAPVREDEYDPFNPSIDVFPISKYTIEKNGSRTSRKWPLFSRNILKLPSNQGPDQDTSEAQNEYVPTRTTKNKASESLAYPEPVAYVPSSRSQPSKTDSSQPEATGQHHPPKVSDQPPISRSTQPTEQRPPALSRPHQPVTCQSEQLHDSPTQPRNSSSPTDKPAVSGPSKSIGASGMRQQQSAESRKHRSDILPELCSKKASNLVLPQLNLSRIGDNLLSGVREALNTVKALSPNLPNAGDGPPSELIPKESKEMQPPSPSKTPKDPIVLMPSPLKMKPKDNDKHLLHSKIMSSIKTDSKYLNKITGNVSKSEELKAKQAPDSAGDKCSSERALQSGKLWRKRKRNVVSEPKGILKKSRSNDEFTEGMQFNSSSGSEQGTINKIVHSGSKSMKLGDVVSPGSVPACSIASVISDKTCDDKGRTHSSRVEHLAKSEINTSVDVTQKQIAQNSAREGDGRCGSAIKPGPIISASGSVTGVTNKANHLRPGSRMGRSASNKASQKSSAPKSQEQRLKPEPELAQKISNSRCTIVDDITSSEKQLTNELRRASCSSLDLMDAVAPLTHTPSADEHLGKVHLKDSVVKIPTHHEGQKLPATVERSALPCQEMPAKLDVNTTTQGSSGQVEHGRINSGSSELFNFDGSNNQTAGIFDGALDVGRKAETENDPHHSAVQNAYKGPSVMDLDNCHRESQASIQSRKTGASKCTKKSDERMTSDSSEKQQVCANQDDAVFESVVMSNEQHNEQSDGDWIGDVSNSSSEASTHSCPAANQTRSFEVLSTPEATASSPHSNDKINTETSSCGVPMELDKEENQQAITVKDPEIEKDLCSFDKTTDLSLLDIILKQSPEEPLHVDSIMYAASSHRNSKPENQLSSDHHSANSSTKHPKPSSVLSDGTGESGVNETGHKTPPMMVSNKNSNTNRDASLRTANSSPGSQVMLTDKLKTEIKMEGCYTFISNSEADTSLPVKTEKNWTPNTEDKGDGSRDGHQSRRRPDEDSLSESVIVLSDDDENISNQLSAESSSASSYYSSDEHSSEESQADRVEEMSTSSGDCNDDENEGDAKASSDGQNESSFADVYSSGECSGSGHSSSSSSSDPDAGSDTDSSDCNSDGDSSVDDDDDDDNNDDNKNSDEAGNESMSEESEDDGQSESGISSNSAASSVSNLDFRRCKGTLANADTSMAVNFDSDSNNNNNNTDCDKASSDLVSGLSASNDPPDSTAEIGTGLFVDPVNDSELSNMPDGEMSKCRSSSRDKVKSIANGVEDGAISFEDNLGDRMKYQTSSQRKASASRNASHRTETPSDVRLGYNADPSCQRSARYELDRPSNHPGRYVDRSAGERPQTSDRYKSIRHDRLSYKDMRRSPTRQLPDKVGASFYQSGRHR